MNAVNDVEKLERICRDYIEGLRTINEVILEAEHLITHIKLFHKVCDYLTENTLDIVCLTPEEALGKDTKPIEIINTQGIYF